ncbi:hypothetical protein [Faecalibacillus intestinalis]|mgnify:FL=1|uniref:hypothetical protein n=1 Tax=Faecalibacillus intestinalis TaxID=1982626 RepID=UPI000E49A68E|nr:hypothetical protein [Faecalibacillus intestinalis]RHP55279.1 hypothetical protein DWZ30_04250 [Coprobacillus sp. AF31-1BH]RHP75443.1 hypothetical protein DXA62_06035 [Coprobacillus sp. OF03-2AA]
MKKFSEDHGGVAIIPIVIAVLLLIVGSVKGLDEGTGKVNGSGVQVLLVMLIPMLLISLKIVSMKR